MMVYSDVTQVMHKTHRQFENNFWLREHHVNQWKINRSGTAACLQLQSILVHTMYMHIVA